MNSTGWGAALVATLVLTWTPAARAQTSQPTSQVVGIASGVTLRPGDSMVFSNASQSLEVEFQHSKDPFQDVPSVAVAFDGQVLTVEGPTFDEPADDNIVIVSPYGPSTCVSVNGLHNSLRCPISSSKVAFTASRVSWNLLAVTRTANISTTINSNIGPFYT